jgi:hypothetical protein
MSISFYQLLLIALTPAVLSISDGEFVNDRYPTLAMMTASNCVAVLVGVIVDGAGDWHHAYRANAYTWLLVWCGPGLAAAAGYLLWAYAWTTRNFDRLTGRTLRNPDQPNYVPAPNKQSEAT